MMQFRARQPNALFKRPEITFSIKIMSLQRKFVIGELFSRNMQMHRRLLCCTFIFMKYLNALIVKNINE